MGNIVNTMFGKRSQRILKIFVAIIGIGGMLIFTLLPLFTGGGYIAAY